ncbi:MAG: hypothetical protein IKV61_05560 [Clostridia bacterium]|nr:hypothetical protein [Clostridia bacterium]
MQILRLIIGVLAIIIFTKIGVNRSKIHEQIYIYYSDLCIFCNYYISELKFSKQQLKTLLNKEYASSEFLLTLNSFFSKKNNEIQYFPLFLSEIELNKLNSFFNIIGKGDSESQKGLISSFLEDFTNLKNLKYNELTKYKSFYKKLGFYVGLIMLIMVI